MARRPRSTEQQKKFRLSIQTTIALSFTVLSVFVMAFLGTTLYNLFAGRMEAQAQEDTRQLLNQTGSNLELYLRNMRLISDTMYYSVIKETELDNDNLVKVKQEMNLLYEANKDNLVSIACYSKDGKLLASAPLTEEKDKIDVKEQGWFIEAMGEMENFHFSTPHVQNLFDSSSYRYSWVVSLSRAVELTRFGRQSLGVLVIDTNYSSIEQMFSRINKDNEGGYVYLTDSQGQIIYHPKRNLINAGLYSENNIVAAGYSDGSRREIFEGENRLVTVKTVSYTGWKMVAVTPTRNLGGNLYDTRYLAIIVVSLAILALIWITQLVSARITRPLDRLTGSVEGIDMDQLLPETIYVGGTYEVESLGNTLRNTVERMRKLMDDIVVEQEEKRKSELDALQSQINPHFLYNTLDSIVWMIEDEKYKEAISMITELASLFRISLSKGKTIIKIEDELKHAQSYLNIQKVRYKNNFEASFDIDPKILDGSIVKLVVQPLLENAIYYATESMYGDGEITITGRLMGGDVYITVADNGMGMTSDVVAELLKDDNRVRKKGSGVGLINVHKRIGLRFGKQYGLIIESEPDEGTKVTIHVPYRPYEEGSKDEQ